MICIGLFCTCIEQALAVEDHQIKSSRSLHTSYVVCEYGSAEVVMSLLSQFFYINLNC